MKKDEFKIKVHPGSYIYDKKRKVISKVTRIFPVDNPSYAEYDDNGTLWGVFYLNAIHLTPEDLIKLKEKRQQKSQENNGTEEN